MNSTRKWKISTYLLAAVSAVSIYRGVGASEPSSVEVPSARDSSFQKRMSSLGRLRIPAGIAGVDERQLLRDLAAASSPIKIRLICERLGIFGSDLSVGPLEDLSVRRPELAGVALTALGTIGSDEATDRLINIVGRGASRRSSWAVSALAKTKNLRAEAQLIEWAQGAPRAIRLVAIDALGEVGGDDVLDVLYSLSLSGDREILGSVVRAAGTMATPEATSMMMQIADKGGRQLRLEVLYSFPASIDSEQQEWLMGMLAGADNDCASAAAEALGRARAGDALPLLIDVASKGQARSRIGAIRALAKIGGDKSVAALTRLLAGSDRQIAYELGSALIMIGEEGRSAFLETMKAGHPMRRHMVHLLAELEGDDVEALRLDIARNGRPEERDAMLAQLANSDDEVALEMMLDAAKNGTRSSRSNALHLLGRSSSPQALEAINEIARAGGQTGMEAMRFLGERASTDPEAHDILVAALYSGNRMQAQSASWALASAGSDAANEALVGALSSGDRNLAESALSAVGQLGANPEVVTALMDLARNTDEPSLKSNALYRLVDTGAPEALDLIAEAVGEGKGSADSVLYNLMQQDGPKVEAVIDAAMRSDSVSTRASIATSLASRGDSESVARLVQLSRDEDANVKGAAVQAMASLGTKESMDRVIEMAKNGDVTDRVAAISALGYSGDTRTTEVLVSALGSGEQMIVQSAIYSANSAGPEVDEALLRVAEDADAEMYIRQQAVNTIVSRGSSLDGDKLKALQEELGIQDNSSGYIGLRH